MQLDENTIGYRLKASLKDLREFAVLFLVGGISVLVPARHWECACNLLASAGMPFYRNRSGILLDNARHINSFGENPQALSFDNRDIVRAYFKNRLVTMDQHLLKKWQPRIRIDGRENLDPSGNSKQGVIFLVAPFAYSSLIVKMGLASENILVHHLTHPAHGYSNTPFGRKTLNRIRTSIEDRFIGKRVTLDESNYAAAIRILRRTLMRGGPVSITLGDDTARPVKVPVFDATLTISSVPFRLAKLTGALIYPVFGVNDSGDDYTVYIDKALNRESAGSAVKKSLEQLMISYAGSFEKHAAIAPIQVRGGFVRMDDFFTKDPHPGNGA